MALGLAAAALMVLGHHPWDGPALPIVEEHGLHLGDALALVPVATSVVLARRWWRRRPTATVTPRGSDPALGATGPTDRVDRP